MTNLRKKLFANIDEDFMTISKVVLEQFINLKKQIANSIDENLFSEIKHNERIIDGLETKIRDEVINTIVLYSPRAGDLRKIMSYFDMTLYLERIGDLLLNIHKHILAINTDGVTYNEFKSRIIAMLEKTEHMTRNSIYAFDCEDNKMATKTIEDDDKVDSINKDIMTSLESFCIDKKISKGDISEILAISGMAKNLERIGDNATNLAEAAIYLIEGRNIKHSNL